VSQMICKSLHRLTFIQFIILFNLVFLTNPALATQQLSGADKYNLQRAERAADEHIQQLRATLDFTKISKEIFTFKLTSISRGFLVRGLSSEEANREALKLERSHVSSLNNSFLTELYEIRVANAGKRKAKPEDLHPEIAEAINKSKYFGKDSPPLGIPLETDAQLEEYIAEADHLSSLYRKYISPDVFDIPAPNRQLKENKIIRGDAELGRKAKIYRVSRGVFIFSFVEDKGEMKVFEFGIATQ
jgi:hypothetical protein